MLILGTLQANEKKKDKKHSNRSKAFQNQKKPKKHFAKNNFRSYMNSNILAAS